MMHAYPECYLSSAKTHLAQAFDYAIRDCGIDGSTFTSVFMLSQLASQFEIGNPWAVAGMSGVELVQTVFEESGSLGCFYRKVSDLPVPTATEGRSIPYWVGWSVATYQWSTARTFSDIFMVTDYEYLVGRYETYHQADISLLVHDLELYRSENRTVTNLKRIREDRGLSQSQLAKLAQVGLRSIQMYEQRNNDIDKAQAAVLYRISRVLHCRMEDLLEDPGQSRYEYACVPIPPSGLH